MINQGGLVRLNAQRIDVRDVLHEMLDITFAVLGFDEDGLVSLHSYPFDAHDTHVIMGVESRLLIDLNQRFNAYKQRLVSV